MRLAASRLLKAFTKRILEHMRLAATHHKTVSARGELFQADVRAQFHVASMNAEDFESSVVIWHANVNLTIEPTETPQRRVNGILAVRGSCGIGPEAASSQQQ